MEGNGCAEGDRGGKEGKQERGGETQNGSDADEKFGRIEKGTEEKRRAEGEKKEDEDDWTREERRMQWKLEELAREVTVWIGGTSSLVGRGKRRDKVVERMDRMGGLFGGGKSGF